MVFFRLGKIDRGVAGGEPRSDSPGADAPTAGAAGSTTGAGSIPAVAATSSGPDPLKERSEKKKKPKDEVTAGLGLGAAPGGGEIRAAAGPARAQAGLSVNDFISKTKNQQRQGLKPSGPELIAYARYLGIDPVADHDLLWIAVEALEAPLPSDWTEHFDGNDRVFYYNATTRVSSWTHPLEHTYRETYKTIVNFRNSNLAPQERSDNLHQLQLEIKQLEIDVHKEIAQWSEHTDEQGNRFYFNREERQSTWTDPRPAKCQILYLRMKMLRLLQSGAGATPGFADSKADGSRFGAFPSSEFDDPANKRPKVSGANKMPETVAGTWDTKGTGADKARGSPDGAKSGADSDPGSDSDSGDERKSKKKKKKKKKKKGDAETAAPVRLGAPQKLGTSQSEPSVGGSPRTGASSAAGAGSQHPALGGLSPLDESGLSTQGRARVKAGIRLQPIGPGDEPGQATKGPPPGGASAPSAASQDPSGRGVRNSASVPSLTPAQNY